MVQVCTQLTRDIGYSLKEKRQRGAGSKEIWKYSFWKEDMKNPLQGLGFLPRLSTQFCWVIGGVLRRLHSPEVPGANIQGALQAPLSFQATFS